MFIFYVKNNSNSMTALIFIQTEGKLIKQYLQNFPSLWMNGSFNIKTEETENTVKIGKLMYWFHLK